MPRLGNVNFDHHRIANNIKQVITEGVGGVNQAMFNEFCKNEVVIHTLKERATDKDGKVNEGWFKDMLITAYTYYVVGYRSRDKELII